MKAKIITVGDEILIGQVVNSNASFISGCLYKIGSPVDKVVTIGDNEKDLMKELGDSAGKYDVTIITGGLGPTHDDITKSVLVRFFKDKLILNDKVLRNIKKFFTSRNLEMPGVNLEQALFPCKAKPIFNFNGTAPGIMYNIKRKVIISLPGVPIEMKEMMKKQVIPVLKDIFKNNINFHYKSKTILTTGISESKLFEDIGNIKKLVGDDKIAFLPSPSGVRLRIDVRGRSEKESVSKINRIEKLIRKKAGDYIYGVDEESLEEIVGTKLRKNGLTVSVAESCTGGLLSAKLTDVSGSSDYFIGGVCTYSNNSKIKILGVRKSTILKYGAVSEQTAAEMAVNVRRLFKTDIGISITGIAGPKGGTKDKPVGLIWIGYSGRKNVFTKKFLFGNNREKNRIRAVASSLSILNGKLINYI